MPSDTIVHVTLNTINGELGLINHTFAIDTMILLCPNTSQSTRWSLEGPFVPLASVFEPAILIIEENCPLMDKYGQFVSSSSFGLAILLDL